MSSSRRGISSAITVEKIPGGPPLPAPVETRGEPVSGLKEVRLLCNLIVPNEKGSRLIPRGEIIPLTDVPERWQTSEYIEAPDAFRENKIMMLHDFTCAVPNFDGERIVYRERLLSAYSLVDPTSIPNRVMETLREGEDYASQWDEADRKVKELERHYATEEFSMDDPVIPDDVGFGRNPHDRYSPDSL